MEVLELNLRHDATRHHIYSQLLAQLSPEQRQEHQDRLSSLKVPKKHHHNLSEVESTIDGFVGVSDALKADLHAIYRILAEAEAKAHGCSVEETHFHEVGNGEAIENVAGISLAIEALNPSRIVATPVQIGKGTVKCAHGTLDIPAPATAAILDSGIEVNEERLDGELCTPTSAAVIKHFVQEYLAL